MLQNIEATYNESTPENERNDEDEDLFKLSQFLTKRNEINQSSVESRRKNVVNLPLKDATLTQSQLKAVTGVDETFDQFVDDLL